MHLYAGWRYWSMTLQPKTQFDNSMLRNNGRKTLNYLFSVIKPLWFFFFYQSRKLWMYIENAAIHNIEYLFAGIAWQEGPHSTSYTCFVFRVKAATTGCNMPRTPPESPWIPYTFGFKLTLIIVCSEAFYCSHFVFVVCVFVIPIFIYEAKIQVTSI